MNEIPDNAIEFAKAKPGVEAVIQRIGLNNVHIVLIAEDGEWLRVMAQSLEEAKKICTRLEVESHDGYTDTLRQKMGRYQRSARDWAEAPYPERVKGTST